MLSAVLVSVALVVASTPPPLQDILDLLSGGGSAPVSTDFCVVTLDGGNVPLKEIEQQTVANDAGTTTWTNVPEMFEGGHAAFLSDVSSGDTLTLSCSVQELYCVFTVALLSCSPCSAATNGNLPQLLLDAGFEAAACSIQVEVDGVKYGSKYYRKTVSGTDPVSFPLQGKSLKNAVVFSKTASQSCESIPVSFICPTVANCEWNGSECVLEQMCPVIQGAFMPNDCTCPSS